MPAVLRTAGEIYSATPSNDSPRLKQNSRPAMPAVLRTAGEIYSAAPSNDSPRLKQNSRPIRDESYLYNSRGTTRIPAQRGLYASRHSQPQTWLRFDNGSGPGSAYLACWLFGWRLRRDVRLACPPGLHYPGLAESSGQTTRLRLCL